MGWFRLFQTRKAPRPASLWLPSNLVNEEKPDNNGPAWHDSNPLWAPVAIGIGMVLAVIAAMTKDIRWLLAFAWPFLAFGIWGVCRGIQSA